jgi:hypothetical protein
MRVYRVFGVTVKHFFIMGLAIFENLGSYDHAFSQALELQREKKAIKGG